jgi:hypothetical protein
MSSDAIWNGVFAVGGAAIGAAVTWWLGDSRYHRFLKRLSIERAKWGQPDATRVTVDEHKEGHWIARACAEGHLKKVGSSYHFSPGKYRE